jgi:hypothetical protein
MFKKSLIVAATTLLAVSAASASAQGPCPSSLSTRAGQVAHHAVCEATTSQHFVTPDAPAQHQNALQPLAGLQPKNSQRTLQPLRLS